MKKKFFAQNKILTATGHKAAYFKTQELAREFLQKNGGGTIKKRTKVSWLEIEVVNG